MSNSPNIELPYVQAAQAQKHVTVNEAFRRIDAVMQLAVIDRNRTSPPGAPQEGDRHVVAAGATGAWAGRGLDVAAYLDGAWVFFAPKAGWVAFVSNEGVLIYFNGTQWEILTAVGASETVSKFGINATADTTNRLVVKADAALFVADDTKASPTGDVRVKASKTAPGDTASHLFQSNYSGRAEFGLIGNDDFSLKVSANGSTWNEAFSVNRATGAMDLNKVPTMSGVEALSISISSFADIPGVRIPADTDQIETRGYAAEGDGGGARYVRVSAFPSDGLGATDLDGVHWALVPGLVTARQAGAVGNGVTDDTAALNRATNSGRNVFIEPGNYRVTDAVSTGSAFQQIRGSGRGRTIFLAGTDFNMSATGIIRLDDSFCSLSEFEVAFDQSPTTSRATLVAYPAAIQMTNRTRTRLTAIRITRGYNGVDARQNTGGAILEDIECGTLNEGIVVDGALDTVEVRNCRVWPYNFVNDVPLGDIFRDGENIAFRFGHVDDLKMSACTPFRCRVIFEQSSINPGKSAFGTVSGLTLDGPYSRMEMSAGALTVSGLYATTRFPNDFFVLHTGGDLAISDFEFDCTSDANKPLVRVDGSGANCQFQNGKVGLSTSTLADGFVLGVGHLSLSSVRFSLNPHTVRVGDCIRQEVGDITCFGVTVNGIGSGSGTFLKVTTDGNHVLVGNDANGWDVELPASRTNGLYGPNNDGTSVRFDRPFEVYGATTASGGEITFMGGGPDGDIELRNSAGNLRASTLDAGRGLQVATLDGTTTVRGDRIVLGDSMSVWRGLGDDTESVAVGRNSLPVTTSGTLNTALGRESGKLIAGGGRNTAIGANALRSLVNGSRNTAVGFEALGATSSGTTNASGLGYNAQVNGNNQVQLGDSLTDTYTYGAVKNRSDARDKADVRDTALGLSFIMKLRPVDYRWDMREDYKRPIDLPEEDVWNPPAPGSKKRSRYHHGFLAQDLETVIADTGEDFGGYQDHQVAGGNDVKSLGYTEFIAPLVKAVQELCRRVMALEAQKTEAS
ncbi:MAG: DUF2793 domain-containing protein [Devosia sp.]